MTLTQSELKNILSYDPNTGLFLWLKPLQGRRSNKFVGSITNGRHLSARINGKSYLLHRLAWLYITGEEPDALIDHKDNNGFNNIFENLRLCTQQQNSCNQKRRKSNTSGFKGVSWHQKNKKWAACICVNRRTIHLGTFENINDAAQAYVSAANEHHGKFARVT